MEAGTTLQINSFRGKTVKVHLKNGHTTTGKLSFFNYDEQIIHLQNFETLDQEGNIVDSGTFTVINKYSWYNLTTEEKGDTKW